MRVVTWNIFSLNARREFLGLYLDDQRPDVIGLQEVKLEEHRVPVELFESRGYHVAMCTQKQWNGVLLASREPITDVHKGLPRGDEGQARLVAGTTFGVRFVNLYCPQGATADSPKFAYKLRFLDELIGWLDTEHDPSMALCVLGDLNIAPEPDDVFDVERMQGVPTYHPEEHARWARLIDWGLVDAVKPHLEPGRFSFWEYMGGAFHRNRGLRIDHILVSEALAPAVVGADIHRAWRKKRGPLKPSDHAPVVLELDL